MNQPLRRLLPSGRLALAIGQMLVLAAVMVVVAPGRAGAADRAAGVYALHAQIPFPKGCIGLGELAGLDAVTDSVVTIAGNPKPDNRCPGLPDGAGVWLRETPAATLVPGPFIKLDLPAYVYSAFDNLASMSIDAKTHALYVLYAGATTTTNCSLIAASQPTNWLARFDLEAIKRGARLLEPAQLISLPIYVDPTADGSQSVSSDDPTAVFQTGPACAQDLAPYDFAYDPRSGSFDVVEDAISPFSISVHGSGVENAYPMWDFHLDRAGNVKWAVQLGKCTEPLPTDPQHDAARRTVMAVHLGAQDLVAGGCMYTRAPSSGTGSGGGSNALPTVGSMLTWVIRIGSDGSPSAPAYYLGRSNVQSVVVDQSTGRLLFGAMPPPAVTAASAPGPAAVVFDLAHLSYIGAPTIDATLADGTTSIPSITTAGGRWYSAGRGGVFVGATNSTPVGQGLRYQVYSCYTGVLLADPVTHRVFVQPYASCPFSGGAAPYFQVFQDANPSLASTTEPPPDSLTQQLAERAGVTQAQFSGHSEAVGARLRLVGGTGGLVDGATFGLLTSAAQQLGSPLPADYSSRELDFGVVRAADLNNYEANAHAEVADADAGTQAQLTQNGSSWPFTEQTCSAPSVTEAGRTYSGDSADVVTCAFGKSVTATSQADPLDVAMTLGGQPASGGPVIEIGQAGSKLAVTLDPQAGTLTTVESWATAIIAGTAKIDSVRTTVTCAAHGRIGTAGCSYEKVIGAVYVGGARQSSGCAVSQSGSGAVTDTCAPLLATLNSVEPGLLVFNAPFPDTRSDTYYGSHGGYQSVAQRELFEHLQDSILNYDDSKQVPGLQILYVNDSPTAPSRLDVQLANAEAESHYGILPAASGGLGDFAAAPAPSLPVALAPSAPAGTVVQRSPLAIISQLVQRVMDGVKFLLRSPWQALLVGLTLLLLSWPLVMAVSRRRLLEELS